jgi:cytochrome c556
VGDDFDGPGPEGRKCRPSPRIGCLDILARRRQFVIKRFAMMMAGLAALLGVAGLAGAQDDKPTIKQAMAKLHKGGTAALPSIKKALGADTPDWKGIKKTTILIADLSAAITELEPPKGDQAAYTKQSKVYATNAKALKDAADKEYSAAAKAALGKLNSSCMPCHKSHRPQ